MTVFIYARVSTFEQAEKGDSIENQINECKKWAAYKHEGVECRVFEEKAISGSMPMKDRPQGSIVFNEIKEGDIFIVHKLDRAFRNTRDALFVAEEFQKRGVGFVMKNISENDMSTDIMGKFMFTVFSAIGEMERGQIAGRMSEGRSSRKAKGGFVGGRPGFGYRSVDDPENKDRKLKVKNEWEQSIVAELKQWINKQKTYQGFSNMMKQRGTDKNASAWHKIHKREL